MLVGMEGLRGRLSSAEDELSGFQLQVVKIRMHMSQMVPRTDLQLVQAELHTLQAMSAEAAITAASALSAAALDQHGVTKQLHTLLKSQQEECAGLQDRIKVGIVPMQVNSEGSCAAVK
jgi:flagellar biosynthesis chaperone FliJ